MNHRIKEFRELLGMSDIDFAKGAGIQTNQIRGYEDNTIKPSLSAIEKIAETYKVNPAWLVGWSDNIKPNKKPSRVCYVADGPSRIPPYLKATPTGHTVRWKQSKRPYIGKKNK